MFILVRYMSHVSLITLVSSITTKQMSVFSIYSFKQFPAIVTCLYISSAPDAVHKKLTETWSGDKDGLSINVACVNAQSSSVISTTSKFTKSIYFHYKNKYFWRVLLIFYKPCCSIYKSVDTRTKGEHE